MPSPRQFTIITFLLCNALSTLGAGPKIFGPPERVIPSGANFSLLCEGDGDLHWTYPHFYSLDVDESEFSVTHDGRSSELLVGNPHFLNTGYYECHQTGAPPDRVYVYVEDSDHLLVVNDSYIMLTALQGESITVPCRPSSPDVNVTLTNDEGIVNVSPDGYNPKVGFTLTNATVTDSGTLVCDATKGDLEEQAYFHLQVNPRSKVIPRPHIPDEGLLGLQVGEAVTLNCVVSVESGVQFRLDWELPNGGKPDDRIEALSTVKMAGESGDQHSTWNLPLSIRGVQKEDEGNYTCRVTVGDRSSTTSHELRVHLPNETYVNLTVEAADIQVRAGASKARWVGRVFAHPNATLTWTNEAGQDFSRVAAPDKYQLTRTGTRFTLDLFDVEALDAGKYAIKASNDAGEMTVPLRLAVRDVPHVRIDAQPLYAAGRDANVSCRVLGFPTPSVVWVYKRCDVLSGLDCQQAPSIPVSGDSITEVHLDESHVQSTVERHMDAPGELTCMARNEEGSGQDTARIRVTDVPLGFTVEAPEEVLEGDNVSLSCAVSTYNYTEQLQWFYAPSDDEELVVLHEGVSVSKGMYSTRATLLLTNIPQSRSGLYECRGVRRSDVTNETRLINVTVLEVEPPEIVESNLNGSIISMSSWEPVEWRCQVRGVPTPTIRWFHDGQPVKLSNGSNFQLRDRNQTLALLTLTQRDEGIYTCRVENKGGVVTASVTLELLGKERIPPYIIAAIAAVGALLVFLTVLLIVRVRRERRRRKELSLAGLLNFRKGAVDSINPALTVHEQAHNLPYDPRKWEFPRSRLKLGKQLGAGAFGVVLKAEAEGMTPGETSTTVAVKMVKRDSDPALVRALAVELKIMAHLGRHAHVVNLLGAVTEQLAERELLLIVEFCRFGNVNNYLQANRSRFVDQLDPTTGQLDLTRTRTIGYERNRIHYARLAFARSVESAQFSGASGDTESTLVSCNSPGEFVRGDYQSEDALPLSTSVLVGWSYQIARGMEWLAGRHVMHGDLAARNVLLADGNIVKICDFGLARSIYSSPEYQKTGDGPLPLKWMAIESIRDRKFSTQSDVWSFGVVLWELFSLARTPYPGFETFPSILSKLLDGYRMEKPEYSPQRLYDIMTECWSADPAKRPSFTDLSCKLGVLLEDSEREHYLELEDEYRRQDEIPNEDYLSMVRPPTYDSEHTYVNAPPSPGYIDMDGDNHELKPMLQPSPESDYLTPREAPFSPTAVSNPSYEPVAQAKDQAKEYGKITKNPVRENISFFESFRKKDSRH